MAIFTGCFVLVLALGMVSAGWGYVALARRMRHFLSVSGKVIARDVVVIPDGNTRTGAFGDGGGYMPRVRYRYTVGGAPLESDKISFAVRGKKHSLAERDLAAIPDDVVVWYNPDKPSEAYLKRHTAVGGILVMALGVLVGLGGALYLLTHLV